MVKKLVLFFVAILSTLLLQGCAGPMVVGRGSGAGFAPTVNNLDPRACPGGYRHNGYGWTCPGGQTMVGQPVVASQPVAANGTQLVPCTLGERMGNFVVGFVVGNVGALGVNKLTGNNLVDREGAGIIAGGANAINCYKVVAQQQQAVQGGQVSQGVAHRCKQNETWTRLNWEGHPQHGTNVCLPEGDPHHF